MGATIKISHEQALKSRNNIKELLNVMMITNTHYAKDINILLDYIEQQKEQEIEQVNHIRKVTDKNLQYYRRLSDILQEQEDLKQEVIKWVRRELNVEGCTEHLKQIEIRQMITSKLMELMEVMGIAKYEVFGVSELIDNSDTLLDLYTELFYLQYGTREQTMNEAKLQEHYNRERELIKEIKKLRRE